MAEFFEVPVLREDGSVGSHYINIEAISYVDLETEAGNLVPEGVRVHLNNGYWFTVSGTKVEEVLSLIRERASVRFKEKLGEN
jgi:dUTPase